MRAAKTTTGYWHWHHPDGFHSLCGRALLSMRIARELDFEHLPPDGEVCVPCEAVRQSGEYVRRATVLEPSRGYVRKTGSLNHGTTGKHRRQRIWDGGSG